MSSELGSLDDVLSDDELCSALADRRMHDVQGDELAATLATWCEALDAAPTSVATTELAEAAARRRSLRRTGRSIAAAAAVAAVCVGGLAVSRLAISNSHDRAPTVDTGVTASQQARQLIWQQLGEARTALMQKHWSTARRLVDAAERELPQVAAGDGRAALESWIVLIRQAVDEKASLTPDTVPRDVASHNLAPQSYNGGVPLPPSVNSAQPTQANTTLPILPTTLPSLRPTTVPSGAVAPPGTKAAPTTLPSHPQPKKSAPPVQSPINPSRTASPSPTEPSPTLPYGPNSPTYLPPHLLPLPTAVNPQTPSDSSTETSADPTSGTSAN